MVHSSLLNDYFIEKLYSLQIVLHLFLLFKHIVFERIIKIHRIFWKNLVFLLILCTFTRSCRTNAYVTMISFIQHSTLNVRFFNFYKNSNKPFKDWNYMLQEIKNRQMFYFFSLQCSSFNRFDKDIWWDCSSFKRVSIYFLFTAIHIVKIHLF